MPEKKRRLLLIGLFSLEALILFLIFLCLRVGSPGPLIEASSTHTLTLPAPTARLRIINPRGELVVRGQETDHVELRATKRAFGRALEEANRLLEAIDLSELNQDGELTLQVDLPQPAGGLVDLEVVLPSKLDLMIQTGLGDVLIEDMEGHARVCSQIGSIAIRRFSGDLSVEAGLGEVQIQDATILAELTVWAGMGDVEFAGSPGLNGRIRAKMGDITLHLPEGFPPEVTLWGEDWEKEASFGDGPDPIQGCLAIWADMGKVSIKGLEVEVGD